MAKFTDSELAAKLIAIEAGSYQGDIDSDTYYDAETSHGLADDLLEELLESLGYTETVAAYRNVTKWYA